MRVNIISSAVVAILLALGILIYFQYTAPRLAEAPAEKISVSLRLSGPPGPQYAGEILALQADMFKREKLQIEVKSGGNGTDSIASVINGTDTFGTVDSGEFLIARSKGAPIVAIGARYLESPVVFYSLAQTKVHSPQDFINKRVIRQGRKDTAIIYDALLEKLGISRSNVRETAKDDGVDALIDRIVDVFPGHVGEESYVLKKRGVQYSAIRPLAYGIHVPGSVYFTTEKIIREHPSDVRSFLHAIIAGWNLTYADYSKSVPVIVAATGNAIPPEQVRFQLEEQRDYILPLARRVAEFDDMQWKQLKNILINERLIKDTFDMSKAVNYEFLREAYRKPINFGNRVRGMDEGRPSNPDLQLPP